MENGRDEKGRFTNGWKGGPGRPKRDVEMEYVEAVIASCSLSDWRAIVKKAVEQAKRGNPVARKWLSDYLVPPLQWFEHSGANGTPLLFRVVYEDDQDDS